MPRRRKAALDSLDDVDPELLRTYEKLGIPIEQKALAGVAVDAVFDSVSVATTFRQNLPTLAPLFDLRGSERAPGAAAQYLARCPAHRQLLRRAQRRVYRWHLCLRPQGRDPPDGVVDLFPHQCPEHRFERTLIADEGSYVSYLEGCTYPAREPVARGGRRTGRDGGCADQYHGAELVPRDEQGRGGIYNFVTKRMRSWHV